MATDVVELIDAGRAAMQRNDWDAAYALLQEAAAATALDAAGYADLAQSAWWSGHPDECIDYREQAHTAFIKDGEPARAALLAMDIAEGLFHKQAMALGMGWVKRAERLLSDLAESAEHGWLARMQAVIAFEGDQDLEAGLELAQRAYDLAVKYGDLNLQALALHDQGRIMVAQGSVEDGMGLMDEAMVAAVGGDLGPYYTGKIYCNMIDICEQLADYRRAGDWSDAARRWCERAGHSSGFPGVCRIHRAEIMRLRGEWAGAEEEAEKASHELGNFVDFAGEAFYEIGEIRLHRGDFRNAEEAFQRAHGLGRDPQPGLAELHLAQGQTVRAWTLIAESLANAQAPLKRARLLPTAVEIALQRDDVEGATAAADEIERVADDYGSPALVAHARQARGAIHLHNGSTEEAIGHLRQAVDLWRTNDFPYLAARSRLALGHAYLAHGSEDSARMEFTAARTAFEELGAMADARRALEASHGSKATATGERAMTALMFTDIVDSTALIGVIGDGAWEQLLRWHHNTLRSLFAAAGGREVENTGDGFFAAFDNAAAAADCAIAIQRTLHDQRAQHGFAPQVRIGLHVGEVTEMAATLAGEEVHKAARIAGLAGGGEILASAELAQALERSLVGDPATVELKGIAHAVEVIPVLWD